MIKANKSSTANTKKCGGEANEKSKFILCTTAERKIYCAV